MRSGEEPVPGYRLQERLGRGSFGEVWHAIGPGGINVAMKFLNIEGKEGLKEFKAIQWIKQIRNPHLMPILGLWVIDHNGQVIDDAQIEKSTATRNGAMAAHLEQCPCELVVAMLLADQDLAGRLAECRAAGHVGIPPLELLDHLEDAARGIDFLNSLRHDLGWGFVAIQHGDIKPQNIMLVGGSAQVCDFGLARALSGGKATTATHIAGSPAYMSPECITEKKPSAASDQYSLAVTYVELRTGELPFEEKSFLGVLQAHIESRLKLDELPEAERAVIRRATARVPEERFSNCQEMVWALRHAGGFYPETMQAAVPIPTRSVAASLPEIKAISGTMVVQDGQLLDELSVPRSQTATIPTSLHDTQSITDKGQPATDWNAPRLRKGRWTPFVVGLLTCAALGFGAWKIFENSPPGVQGTNVVDRQGVTARQVDSADENSPSASEQATTAPPATDAIPLQLEHASILIFDPVKPSRKGVGANAPGALPLKNGDKFGVALLLSKSAYLYLVWIDSKGKAVPLFPWTPGDWTSRPTTEQPVSKFILPSSETGEAWPIDGSDGMESLLILARESPLPDDIELSKLLDDLPAQPLYDDANNVAWFDHGQVTVDRGRIVSGLQPVAKPMLNMQRRIAEQLEDSFELIRSVCIPLSALPAIPLAQQESPNIQTQVPTGAMPEQRHRIQLDRIMCDQTNDLDGTDQVVIQAEIDGRPFEPVITYPDTSSNGTPCFNLKKDSELVLDLKLEFTQSISVTFRDLEGVQSMLIVLRLTPETLLKTANTLHHTGNGVLNNRYTLEWHVLN